MVDILPHPVCEHISPKQNSVEGTPETIHLPLYTDEASDSPSKYLPPQPQVDGSPKPYTRQRRMGDASFYRHMLLILSPLHTHLQRHTTTRPNFCCHFPVESTRFRGRTLVLSHINARRTQVSNRSRTPLQPSDGLLARQLVHQTSYRLSQSIPPTEGREGGGRRGYGVIIIICRAPRT